MTPQTITTTKAEAALIGEHLQIKADLAASLGAALTENLKLREMLKTFEWRGIFSDYCIFCNRIKTEGHNIDCELAKLLK